MGTLTGAQIEFELRSMLPEARSDRIISSQILRLINAAYQFDLAGKWDIPELDATDTEDCTAAQTYITFSVTDVLRIKSVCITDSGLPLTVTSADGFTRLLARSGDATGEPTHYYRTGTTTSGQVKLNLYPTPTTTTGMTLNYSKRPTALTVNTATAIDSLYDEALIYYAAARLARYLGAFGSKTTPNLVAGFEQAADMLLSASVRRVRDSLLDTNPDETFIFWGEPITGAMR